MQHVTLAGGCLCGAVRYEASGDALMVALCHCTYCRRASGAPMVAWAMYAEAQFRCTKGALRTHPSSDGVRRQFCAGCGTQIAFRADYIDGLVDVTVASLDTPAALPPRFHYWDSERLPWLKVDDGLPRHAQFPPQG